MKLFATGDQHFRHFNIIRYADRPFELSHAGVQECGDTIIREYNSIVTDEDVVLFLGDLFHGRKYREADVTETIGALNGRKILFRGNHDPSSVAFYLSVFEEVHTCLQVGPYFISHYPCYQSQWTSSPEKRHMAQMAPETTHVIHGHIHNKDPSEWEPDGLTRVNTCVDFTPNDFAPLELTDPLLLEHFLRK